VDSRYGPGPGGGGLGRGQAEVNEVTCCVTDG
jgi:hypothetical protein